MRGGIPSLTEAIDTTTPEGRMMMQMIGAFAEFHDVRCIAPNTTDPTFQWALRERSNPAAYASHAFTITANYR